MSGLSGTNRLGREIGVALVAKVAALAFLYFAFFDAAHRPNISPAAMSARLFEGHGTPRP